jgi:cholesterol oxidase
VFDDDWPEAINRAELDPYYTRTELALQPVEVPAAPALPKVAAFDAVGQRMGKQGERLPLAVYFGEDRRHPFSGVPQRGCTNTGRCDIGCPRHAKNTVDITYIARAETHGAEVYPLHEVDRLEAPQRAGDRWSVHFRDLQYRNRGVVQAPIVVLAAGSLGTSRLLLKNRRRLQRLSPALGSRFSGNGDALGAAFDPKATDIQGAQTDYGPTMTSMLDYTAEHEFILADGGLPTNFGGLLRIVRELDALTGWGRQLLRLRNLAVWLGLSDAPVKPRHVNLRAPRQPISDSLVFLMFGRDAANGQMRLTPLFKRFDIRWDKKASKPLFDAMKRVTEEPVRTRTSRSTPAL